ncbi:MAG: hypothetical protein SPJ23_07625 [Eubacteriales bacterium]|nr:hypothetical protein [Eubacteriales bacterium]
MKKCIAAIITAVLVLSVCAPLCGVSAAENVRFVTDGGAGDGKTSAGAMGDLADAIEELATDGGTIVIVGSYDLTTSRAFIGDKAGTLKIFSEPVHSGAVTITGSYDGINYNGTIRGKNDSYYCLSGDTTFENLVFDGDGATYLFSARFNAITFGENFDISAFRKGAYIVGGYNNSDTAAIDAETGINYGGTEERNVSITIKSGTFRHVVGLNRYLSSSQNSIDYTGTVTVNVCGTGMVEALYAGTFDSRAQNGGDCIINLDEEGCIMNLQSDYKLPADGGINSLTVNVKSKDAYLINVKIGAGVKSSVLYYAPDAETAVETIIPLFGASAKIGETPVTTDAPTTTAAPTTDDNGSSSSPTTGDITIIVLCAVAVGVVLLLVLLRRKKAN